MPNLPLRANWDNTCLDIEVYIQPLSPNTSRTFRTIVYLDNNKKAMNCDIGNWINESVRTICTYLENPMK